MRGGKHVLTCGPTGTGKTINIAQYLMGQTAVTGRWGARSDRPIAWSKVECLSPAGVHRGSIVYS